MKNKITTIIVFFISISCFSQSITPAVANVAGGVSQKGYYVFEWSVGEMSLTNEMTSTTNLLVTNGFLQPYFLHHWVNNSNDEFTSDEIKVFPNPASSYLEINYFARLQGRLYIHLFDAVGQKIYSSKTIVYGVDLIKRIPVNHLPAGSYLVRIELNADPYYASKQGVYKIIKVD
jgi:hypothetical protein